MNSKHTDQLVGRQSNSVDRREDELSTAVANELAILRGCVQQCGWTLDALEAEMRIDKSLISRILNGERPVTLKFVIALPDDIEALYMQRRAESFGLIVVAPLTGVDAQRAFVAGAIGLMAGSHLPSRAAVTAKADIRPAQKAAVGE